MSEVNQEEPKEFWEWCGLVFKSRDVSYGEPAFAPSHGWYNSDGQLVGFATPRLTLDNLFRWAVPKVLQGYGLMETYWFSTTAGLFYSETCIWERDDIQLKGKLLAKAWTEDFDLEKANIKSTYEAIQKVREEQ